MLGERPPSLFSEECRAISSNFWWMDESLAARGYVSSGDPRASCMLWMLKSFIISSMVRMFKSLIIQFPPGESDAQWHCRKDAGSTGVVASEPTLEVVFAWPRPYGQILSCIGPIDTEKHVNLQQRNCLRDSSACTESIFAACYRTWTPHSLADTHLQARTIQSLTCEPRPALPAHLHAWLSDPHQNSTLC